jgi:hypothetical protein
VNTILKPLRAGRRLLGRTAAARRDDIPQNGVSKLRRELGHGRVKARAPGYVLRVPPERIDARRWRRERVGPRRTFDGVFGTDDLPLAVVGRQESCCAEFGLRSLDGEGTAQVVREPDVHHLDASDVEVLAGGAVTVPEQVH